LVFEFFAYCIDPAIVKMPLQVLSDACGLARGLSRIKVRQPQEVELAGYTSVQIMVPIIYIYCVKGDRRWGRHDNSGDKPFQVAYFIKVRM
jgi:hypothetical protein